MLVPLRFKCFKIRDVFEEVGNTLVQLTNNATDLHMKDTSGSRRRRSMFSLNNYIFSSKFPVLKLNKSTLFRILSYAVRNNNNNNNIGYKHVAKILYTI